MDENVSKGITLALLAADSAEDVAEVLKEHDYYFGDP